MDVRAQAHNTPTHVKAHTVHTYTCALSTFILYISIYSALNRERIIGDNFTIIQGTSLEHIAPFFEQCLSVVHFYIN